MAIDFTDKNQTTHNGEEIPINTQEKYNAGRAILQRLYAFYGVPWTGDSETNYEQRVRDGQTFQEIVYNTYEEYLTRTDQPHKTPKS